MLAYYNMHTYACTRETIFTNRVMDLNSKVYFKFSQRNFKADNF